MATFLATERRSTACGGQPGRHRQPAGGRGSSGALLGSLQSVQLVLTLSLGKSTAQLCLRAHTGTAGMVADRGRTPRPFSPAPLLQTLAEHLTVAQHTQLVLTLLQGLCSHDSLNSHLASELLLTIMEDRSIKPEQVGHQVGAVRTPGLFTEAAWALEAGSPEAALGHQLWSARLSFSQAQGFPPGWTPQGPRPLPQAIREAPCLCHSLVQQEREKGAPPLPRF